MPDSLQLGADVLVLLLRLHTCLIHVHTRPSASHLSVQSDMSWWGGIARLLITPVSSLFLALLSAIVEQQWSDWGHIKCCLHCVCFHIQMKRYFSLPGLFPFMVPLRNKLTAAR